MEPVNVWPVALRPATGAIAPIHPDGEGLSMAVVTQSPDRKVCLGGPAGRWESTYTADVLVTGNSEMADLADRCPPLDREGIWVGTRI